MNPQADLPAAAGSAQNTAVKRAVKHLGKQRNDVETRHEVRPTLQGPRSATRALQAA